MSSPVTATSVTNVLCLLPPVVSCQYLLFWSGPLTNPSPLLLRFQWFVQLIADDNVTENADAANDDTNDVPAAVDDATADDADADDAEAVNGLLRAWWLILCVIIVMVDSCRCDMLDVNESTDWADKDTDAIRLLSIGISMKLLLLCAKLLLCNEMSSLLVLLSMSLSPLLHEVKSPQRLELSSSTSVSLSFCSRRLSIACGSKVDDALLSSIRWSIRLILALLLLFLLLLLFMVAAVGWRSSCLRIPRIDDDHLTKRRLPRSHRLCCP